MAKKKVKTKAESERVHAIRRAQDRFGVTLNRDGYDHLCSLIKTGRAEFVRRQSHRVTVFRLTLGDQPCHAVYSTATHQIVTFMPLDYRYDYSRAHDLDDVGHWEPGAA